ncbi:hypothetical protein C8Q80DRAFT_1273705 [Daedaleopsis nitida]|nr:hypothetical protein C8Q80DRAFT_1273705 [Daedaleopsis nitida]
MLYSILTIVCGAVVAACVGAQAQDFAPYDSYAPFAESGDISDGFFPATLTTTYAPVPTKGFYTVYVGAGYERRNYHPHAMPRAVVQETTTATQTVTNAGSTETVTRTVANSGAGSTAFVTSTVRTTQTVNGNPVMRTATVTSFITKGTTRTVISTGTRTVTKTATRTVTVKA